MKFTAAIITGLLAANASAAFDKYAPWGKRDYYCLNVIQGIPEGTTLTSGDVINIKWNREATALCSDPQADSPASDYKFWLVNDPIRDRDTIDFYGEIIIREGIDGENMEAVFTVPDAPDARDNTAWYLRLDTTLAEAPQMPSHYSVAGPFTIVQ
ncbi:hypothetical protein FQN54_009563 [Arachnomyces sp. PD_36]|nr:hypothetical protein FQN54_009563 [Arachnomyces sp. PD_36]